MRIDDVTLAVMKALRKIQQQIWLKQRFRWHSSGMNNSAAFSAEFRELIHEYCTAKKYKTIAEIETIFDQKG